MLAGTSGEIRSGAAAAHVTRWLVGSRPCIEEAQHERSRVFEVADCSCGVTLVEQRSRREMLALVTMEGDGAVAGQLGRD